jgi:hypothetical protein
MLRLTLCCNDTFELLHGSHNPLIGWFSRAYGQKEEIPVLRCRKEGKTEAISFTTLVTMRDNLDKARLEAIYAQ